MMEEHEHKYVRGICRVCGDILDADQRTSVPAAAGEAEVASPTGPPPPPNPLPVWDALAQALGWERPPFTELGNVEAVSVPVDVFYAMLRCNDCMADMQPRGAQMTPDGPRWLYVCPKCGKGGVANREFPFPNYQNKGMIQRPIKGFRGPNGRH